MPGMVEHYCDRLNDAVRRCGTPAVVGLDPVLENLPPLLRPRDRRAESAARAVAAFCRGVINAVAPHVPAVKINIGFFEPFYGAGIEAYGETIAYAHERGLLVIGDVKRGDIGSTAALYARAHLDDPPFEDIDPARVPDAITLAPYMGVGAMQPFIETAARLGRGLYLLVRPSDPGADEVHEFGEGPRFYEHLADLVHRWGFSEELLGRCGLSCVGAVVAPKDAESTQALRELLPHTPLLVPGYGAQGATMEACRPLFRADGTGAVVNASRSVIYAYNQPRFALRAPEDWTSAVEEAAREFAADAGRALEPA